MQHQYTQYDCEWHVTSNTPTTNIVNIYLHSVFFNESIAFWNVVDVDRRSMIQVLEHQICQKQWFFTFSWRATFCKHSLTNTFDAILNRIVFNLIYFDRWSCVCVMTNVKTSGGYVQLLLCWWWRFVYRVDGWRLAWTLDIDEGLFAFSIKRFLTKYNILPFLVRCMVQRSTSEIRDTNESTAFIFKRTILLNILSKKISTNLLKFNTKNYKWHWSTK